MEDAVEEQLIPSDAINSLLNLWDKKKKVNRKKNHLLAIAYLDFVKENNNILMLFNLINFQWHMADLFLVIILKKP